MGRGRCDEMGWVVAEGEQVDWWATRQSIAPDSWVAGKPVRAENSFLADFLMRYFFFMLPSYLMVGGGVLVETLRKLPRLAR